MAKKKSKDEVPKWVAQMGALTDGTQVDADGVLFPVGYEIADPTPMAIPAGMQTPPSLREQMDELFRVGRLRAAREAEESIDDANDFNIDDYFEGEDRRTPWETEYDPLLGREISAAEFHEKYKSGELLEELKQRFSTMERQEDLEEVVNRLEATYQESRKKTAEVGRPAASASADPKPPQPEGK